MLQLLDTPLISVFAKLVLKAFALAVSNAWYTLVPDLLYGWLLIPFRFRLKSQPPKTLNLSSLVTLTSPFYISAEPLPLFSVSVKKKKSLSCSRLPS